MNLQDFEKPLQPVQNYDATYCPYVKVKNKLINTPVPQPQHFNGKPVENLCVPNLSDRMMIPGFGLNYCENNKPVHLNFNEKSDCYYNNECKEEHKIHTCIDPYIQN
uniref:Uncharacterized protein n=1 Tax=viral metagenome TaxID=1070528 RepID=A0A6C0LEM1_9ZZZZ